MRIIAPIVVALLGLMADGVAWATSPEDAEKVVERICADQRTAESFGEGPARISCRMEFTSEGKYYEALYYEERETRTLLMQKGPVVLVRVERYLAFSIVDIQALERFDLGPISEQYVSTKQEFETGGAFAEAPTPLGLLTTGMSGHAFRGGYERVFDRFCEDDEGLYGVSNSDPKLKEKWQAVLDQAILAALAKDLQEAALR
jgi:hypothetical protein